MPRRTHPLIWLILAGTFRAAIGYALILAPVAAAAQDLPAAILDSQPWHAFLTSPAVLVVVLGAAAAGAALLLLARVRRQQRRLRLIRSMLNTYVAMLDTIPTPIYVRNRELKLTACNTAYARVCGQSRNTLNQTSVESAVQWIGANTLDARALERQYRKTIDAAQPSVEDRTVRMPTGLATLQHWTSPMRDEGGHVVGVVGGWLDVTERQRALTELAEARDRAEAAFRAKSTFLASISHDIRTPMNAIMGMLELTLLHASLGLPERQQLETALQSARSLLSLIDDLLDLSKMEAGKLDLKPSFASLRDIATEVAGVFAPVAHSKGVALDVDIAPSVAGCHFIDPLRLKQILNNLVSNAIRFTCQGRIHIELRATSVRNGCQWVQFSITDSGIGIAPAALPVLFEPFTQAGAAASSGGTGLGLSICKRLADAMGGHIRIRSKLGQGTLVVVRLRLPVAMTPDAEISGQPRRPCAQSPILVIDDQASNRVLLGHQLRKLGHAVVCVENGLQALEAIDRQAFRLAICDCAMPQMNGMEFVRTLRARSDANASMPVLGYTAGAQDANVQEAINAGMNAVLFKPVGLAELKAALENTLAGSPGGRNWRATDPRH